MLAYNISTNKKEKEEAPIVETKIIEKIVEKPVEVIKNIFQEYKRGTKHLHNPDLAYPNIK